MNANKNPTTTTPRDDQNISPVDYRIAIADACGCPEFRDIVINSNSNTNGAIYFQKDQLIAIANEFGIRAPEGKTNGVLRYRIRKKLIEANGYGLTTPITSNTQNEAERDPIQTDGGITVNSGISLSTDRFSAEELKYIADELNAEVDAPYFEPELRRLVGSSIAGPYLIHLLRQAYVDVYLSINVGNTTAKRGTRAFYPFRLEPVHEIPDSASSHPNCYRYVVDSSIGKEDITNEDALDTAKRVGADAVVLADELHDVDGTVDAIIDGLDLYDTHDYNGELIIPLQPPHDECFVKLLDHGISLEHTFALGGLKNCNDDKRKIDAARSLRAVAGEDATIHGLGYGITTQIADAIRTDPALLDSIDYSTPVQAKIMSTKPGKQRLTTVAAEAGAKLIEDIRRVSPLVDATENTQLTEYSS